MSNVKTAVRSRGPRAILVASLALAGLLAGAATANETPAVERVARSLIVRGGASVDPQDKAGLARLTASLLTAGAGSMSEDDLADAMQDFAPLWDALTYGEQQELSAALIERVDFDGAEITVHFRETGRG